MWLERLTVNGVVATVMGSIPASSDTVESEGRQIKQCWISYIKENPKNSPFKKEYETKYILKIGTPPFGKFILTIMTRGGGGGGGRSWPTRIRLSCSQNNPGELIPAIDCRILFIIIAGGGGGGGGIYKQCWTSHSERVVIAPPFQWTNSFPFLCSFFHFINWFTKFCMVFHSLPKFSTIPKLEKNQI